MRTSTRWMGLILVGVVGTTVAVGASEKAIANWMTPARARPRAHHWFLVSPDEKHALACVSKPGETTNRRVLDLRTGALVDVDHDDPNAWFQPLPKSWYDLRQSQSSDGRIVQTIRWTGHRAERTFLLDRRHHISLTSAAGVVFEHVWEDEFYSLVRHDLASGESRAIVRSHSRSATTISPDGERLLLNENAFVARKNLPEQRHVKILDGRDGSEVGLIEAQWLVTWIGSDHRDVRTELDGRLIVLDLERGTRVALETHHGTHGYVDVLDDGSILLQDGDDLTLHDGASGALLRRL